MSSLITCYRVNFPVNFEVDTQLTLTRVYVSNIQCYSGAERSLSLAALFGLSLFQLDKNLT